MPDVNPAAAPLPRVLIVVEGGPGVCEVPRRAAIIGA